MGAGQTVKVNNGKLYLVRMSFSNVLRAAIVMAISFLSLLRVSTPLNIKALHWLNRGREEDADNPFKCVSKSFFQLERVKSINRKVTTISDPVTWGTSSSCLPVVANPIA